MPTLLDLRTAVRRKIDRVNAKTPADDDLTEWINESAAELWDLVVTTYEDQFSAYATTATPQPSVFSIANLSSLFSTPYTTEPLRLFKLRSLECSVNGKWREIASVPKQEWWKYETLAGSEVPAGYTLIGNDIHVLPAEMTSQLYRLFFIPCYARMASDSDELFTVDSNISFSVPNQWHEYVVADVCIKARARFQEDASLEMARKAMLRERIVRAASNRTPGASRKVVDRATHREEN